MDPEAVQTQEAPLTVNEQVGAPHVPARGTQGEALGQRLQETSAPRLGCPQP